MDKNYRESEWTRCWLLAVLWTAAAWRTCRHFLLTSRQTVYLAFVGHVVVSRHCTHTLLCWTMLGWLYDMNCRLGQDVCICAFEWLSGFTSVTNGGSRVHLQFPGFSRSSHLLCYRLLMPYLVSRHVFVLAMSRSCSRFPLPSLTLLLVVPQLFGPAGWLRCWSSCQWLRREVFFYFVMLLLSCLYSGELW